jgi:alkaline phosphatase D
VRAAVAIVVAVVATGCGAAGSPTGFGRGLRARAAATPAARLTHGIAIGEVGATSAVVWGRCDRASVVHVEWKGGGRLHASAPAERDFTGTVVLDGLAPGTPYELRAWCGDDPAAAARGRFRTAPAAAVPAPVRLHWGGDVGGQNVCRDAEHGYAIFDVMRARAPDLFVALGDMIYADAVCRPVGQLRNRQLPGPPVADHTRPSFWAHWRYHRADPAWQRFAAVTPFYAVWDDHEIHDDAGPRTPTLPDAPGPSRLPAARAAFADWQPLAARDPLYRAVRWGRHLELFLLDTRSYRDANRAPDVGARAKTMLGAAQRAWLLAGLAGSDATWKVVVSSVPLAVPTDGDGWADGGTREGFERELTAILAAAHAAAVENMVWLTTDLHFATGFRHAPRPGFRVLELASGPLAAGFHPRRRLDPTLRPERLYFHGPAPGAGPATWEAARRFFNFGELAIDPDGLLTVRIVTAEGAVVFERAFRPVETAIRQ